MVKDLEYNRQTVARWRKLNRQRYLEQHKSCLNDIISRKKTERLRNIDTYFFILRILIFILRINKN